MAYFVINAGTYSQRASFQNKVCLSKYGNPLYKAKMVMKQIYLYNGNSYTGEMASLCWDGPLDNFIIMMMTTKLGIHVGIGLVPKMVIGTCLSISLLVVSWLQRWFGCVWFWFTFLFLQVTCVLVVWLEIADRFMKLLIGSKKLCRSTRWVHEFIPNHFDGLVQDCGNSIANGPLIHWGLVMHVCVFKLGHHWFR